ncbi:MAG: SpoIID/LytB domain-containing protein, partial [Deltaproteobacteria bacterium]|nr:SpoIID/LytB domain-containing protein [Kofleriaceae bacterium]
MHRSRGSHAFALAFVIASGLALAAPAAADGAHAHDDVGGVPASLAPERWHTGVAVGLDRSGDLRPEAIAVLDAIERAHAPLSVAEIPGQDRLQRPVTSRVRTIGADGLPGGDAIVNFVTPPTIRVWRRGLDGSAASCSGRVDVIPFEQYVKGVLPHEWIRSWNTESLKAGSVAIRTYAAAWVAMGGKYSCADLDDTTASQVYRDDFYAVTDAAVDATTGVFVVRGQDLVFAEYSAENGDPTAFGVAESVCSGRAVNGHGRGTCQWGTQRWALEGRGWEWMMTHYYPNSTLVGGGPAWDASLGATDHRTTLTSGEEMVVWLEYGNDGTRAWTRDEVFVGTTGPRDRESAFFKAENWVSPSRPTAVDQATVGPGEVGRFTWAMVAPEVSEETTFTESFALVNAAGEWFGPGDDAVTWTITVVPRDGDDPGDPADPADPNDPDGGAGSGG